jgi:sugar/nucleoside kinase (ribokinase family)
LHDHLTELLDQARKKGCFTVVNTVYDFRNEMESPGSKWPLGKNDDAYSLVDLLITDQEEALRLSGKEDVDAAALYLISKGISSLLITRGSDPTVAYSDGRVFRKITTSAYPVSERLVKELKESSGGDTTGCGDNFVGGILASIGWQLLEGRDQPDLLESIAWGTASGGYCGLHVGGTFFEKIPGEKLELIKPYYDSYKQQLDE